MKIVVRVLCILVVGALLVLLFHPDPRKRASIGVYRLAADQQFVSQLEIQVDQMAKDHVLDHYDRNSPEMLPGHYQVELKPGSIANRIGEAVRANVILDGNGKQVAVYFGTVSFCGFIVKLAPDLRDPMLNPKRVTARTSTICLPRD